MLSSFFFECTAAPGVYPLSPDGAFSYFLFFGVWGGGGGGYVVAERSIRLSDLIVISLSFLPLLLGFCPAQQQSEYGTKT